MQKMTQPKLVSCNKKLYIHYTLDGKRIRKSLNMDDTEQNRQIANNEIIPKIILSANSMNELYPSLNETSY